MKTASMKNRIHSARTVMSFALLGALLAGAFLGWTDHDFRPYGAVLGATGALVAKFFHVL
jgi:hypothetical protein